MSRTIIIKSDTKTQVDDGAAWSFMLCELLSNLSLAFYAVINHLYIGRRKEYWPRPVSDPVKKQLHLFSKVVERHAQEL